MKLWTLMENTAAGENIACEHGLSLYLETGKHRILFDAGQSAAFRDNARHMGVDLGQVDLCVLSHGHSDHGGGLMTFLGENRHATVYVTPHAFGVHYNAAGTYIGLDPALKEEARIRFARDGQQPGEGLTLFSGEAVEPVWPIDPAGLTRLEGGLCLPEDFRHEQYLMAEEAGRRILISGCSHRGILNILERFRPDVLIGGFHFMKLDPEGPALEEAAQVLARYDTQFYTGHCTGLEQFAHLKAILGERLHYLAAGTFWEI